jgi:hypothetical protein
MTQTATAEFPTKTCTRCAGTGEHSFNLRDGKVCYGCSGSGKMWATKAVAEAVEAHRAAQRAARRRLVQELTAGTFVLDTLSDTAKGGEKWAEVIGVEITDKPAGMKLDGTVWAWMTTVTLANGTVRTMSGNQIVRTRAVA